MFIEIRNKVKERFCVCSYLSRKYSVLFSLVECLKVKCNEVFLKTTKSAKPVQRYVVFDRCCFPFGFFKSLMNTVKGFQFLNKSVILFFIKSILKSLVVPVI